MKLTINELPVDLRKRWAIRIACAAFDNRKDKVLTLKTYRVLGFEVRCVDINGKKSVKAEMIK